MTFQAIDRFHPLDHVLVEDDFDRGMSGWMDLRPNFTGPAFAEHSQEVDLIHWGPVMLSSATFPFSGTHGSMSGTYSLKVSSRASAAPADQPPAPGSMGLGIKRLSVPTAARQVQIEGWWAFTAEQDRPGLGKEDVRAFGMFVDLQDGEHRFMPGVRYVNALDGRPVRRWQYFHATEATDEEWNYGATGWHRRGVDPQWFGRRYADGTGDGTAWIDGGGQQLIYNESDDKINWMYVRLVIDLERREYVELESHGQVFDLRGLGPTLAEPYAGIRNLLNPVFFVETDTDRRVSLYLDSVAISWSGSHPEPGREPRSGTEAEGAR